MRAVTRAGLYCKAYNTKHGRQERQENCRQESACTNMLGRWWIDCLREVWMHGGVTGGGRRIAGRV